MIKYTEAPKSLNRSLRMIRIRWFPELAKAKILCVINTKRKSGSSGKITLAQIRKTNDLQKYLTIEGTSKSIEPYDYIVIVDTMAWKHANKEDKVRLIRHELRHTNIIPDAKNQWQLRPHTIEDFHSEIKLNEDKPDWADKLATRVEIAYEKEKEDRKEERR